MNTGNPLSPNGYKWQKPDSSGGRLVKSWKNKEHVKMRSKVKELLAEGLSIEEIAEKLSLKVGSRYERKTVLWYAYCLIAQKNQRKAFEKHGYELYSKAGKIAQKRHPWIGHMLGKKYGSIAGKKRMKQLKESGKAKEYFSMMAKKLHERDPEHSRRNMKKTHEIMKKNGTFYSHQKKATSECMKKHPKQLMAMSKRVHELYPDLVYRSRRKQRENMPYWYKGCKFDSNQEREVCKILVGHDLIDVPVEGKNVQFRIQNYEIDFFLNEKLFLEFHPPIKLGDKIETEESYFKKRRTILDENGFADYPLIVIPHINKAEDMVKEIKERYFQ